MENKGAFPSKSGAHSLEVEYNDVILHNECKQGHETGGQIGGQETRSCDVNPHSGTNILNEDILSLTAATSSWGRFCSVTQFSQFGFTA